jgi:ornithine cyclodeaminase/alanine dehydrogenase-like protein (mu-crystallin family)
MTLILSRSDVLDLLSLPECIDAVERAFRLHAEGRTLGPGVLSVPAAGGGFHIKAAGLVGERSYFAAKTNANFSENPRRWGLPTIQGMIVLADAANGTPLAVIESGSVTALRTGAATAVAAKFLARPDARTATIVGCGVQGEIQLAAITTVLPLQRVMLFDIDHTRAESLAARAAGKNGVRLEAIKDLQAALRGSDVCVTCTYLAPRVYPRERCRAGHLHRRRRRRQSRETGARAGPARLGDARRRRSPAVR